MVGVDGSCEGVRYYTDGYFGISRQMDPTLSGLVHIRMNNRRRIPRAALMCGWACPKGT